MLAHQVQRMLRHEVVAVDDNFQRQVSVVVWGIGDHSPLVSFSSSFTAIGSSVKKTSSFRKIVGLSIPRRLAFSFHADILKILRYGPISR